MTEFNNLQGLSNRSHKSRVFREAYFVIIFSANHPFD
jgi:hypothetical protein